MLGLARRAGSVVIGARAVSAAARRGRLAAVLVASDASERAVERLVPEARDAARVRVGTRATLGGALGRTEVAVAGITDRSLADRVLEEIRRQVP
ncbi:MAG: ribosomal L7Ae/L30e/S12e/Gadd45 family protein [Gemmatimonadetes bacterium]|nr:ribosomal L7Ae/L30e/S12e/Gadd45 family protein [Gemmatimonadota bacterium]